MNDVVLVAEDDADIRGLLALRLLKAGYSVVAAENGERALALAASEKPSLFVLDVSMPKVDGLEVTRRLRSDAETAGVPIILLTARAQAHDLAEGFAAGATDFVSKPFDADDLLARVKQQLEGTT